MCTVEAVKTKAEVELVETLLRKHNTDVVADLWRIGVNMSFRISDLLDIEYENIDFQRREYSTIERKTGKTRIVRLNETALRLIQSRRQDYPTDKYLFQGDQERARGNVRPLSRGAVSAAFQEVGQILGIKLNTHSMRKSRGWAMFSDGVAIEIIAKVLNHTSTKTTMVYLGITQEEVLQTYDDYEL